MTEKSVTQFALDHERLASANDGFEAGPTFNACLNAHGMYETMRFVLRLSPRNHELMERIESNEFDASAAPADLIQAYSTYIHETIHWWQHVGSTSGLLFSLSYLAQCHSSMGELKEVLATIGAKKPLKGYTDQMLLKEGHSAQAKLAAANAAVNNALDVEYYKYYAYEPRENIHWMIEENHFESVGHGYFIVYGQLVGMIADAIDPEFKILPKMSEWDAEVQRLNAAQHEGFYWRSPVRLPATGMRAIYEGQARFIQLQFLNNTQEEPLLVTDLRDMGYFSGVYVEAFERFLELADAEWPEHLDDPLIGLFLLVCDLSINPTRGLPLDVTSFEDLILDVDVGVRFTKLCFCVKELPHLKRSITEYSREEYVVVSGELTKAAGYDHPMEGLSAVLKWLEKAPGLPKLMEEYRTFEYEPMNLPIRVFLSHFVALCQDKMEHPEFFCWPGAYLAGDKNKKEVRDVWLRHLSLFSDRGDKEGVYPRRWTNRTEKAVMDTFQRFYSTMALYDLTRQWLLKDGPFVCDFRWLFENYDQTQAEAWGNESFKKLYGVALDDFELVQ
ncbi:hypothetical protein [Paracoccus sp. PARArs4]|uniref:hypothetical protein n=1 Tax=Paracoccus sp. PARArs4 TaxID=2853442 RepID=UPI0024A7529D|nr:hypothetical protein [Paracoccus sp. PARArs4]